MSSTPLTAPSRPEPPVPLPGLVVGALGVAALVALLTGGTVEDPLETILVLLLTVVPVLGNALTVWDVGCYRVHRPVLARVTQVPFAAAALLLPVGALCVWRGARDPGATSLMFAALAQNVGWILVPWLGPPHRYRPSVAVGTGVVAGALFLGVPIAAIAVAFAHGTTPDDEPARGWSTAAIGLEGLTLVLGAALFAGVRSALARGPRRPSQRPPR
jgi:hypothetical protein